MKRVDFDLKDFQEGAIAITRLGYKVTHLHEFPIPTGEGHKPCLHLRRGEPRHLDGVL